MTSHIGFFWSFTFPEIMVKIMVKILVMEDHKKVLIVIYHLNNSQQSTPTRSSVHLSETQLPSPSPSRAVVLHLCAALPSGDHMASIW